MTSLSVQERVDRACIRYAAERRAEGASLVQICGELGVSYPEVRRYLRSEAAACLLAARGLCVRLRGLQVVAIGAAQARQPRTARRRRIAAAVALRARGLSLQDVAAELAVTNACVRYDLHTPYAAELMRAWGLRLVMPGSYVTPLPTSP